jgi:hypothetical protein
MAQQQFAFGAGDVWGILDEANPTPINFGTLQNVQVDFASSVVELHGSKQLPVAVGRGKMKVSGKAQFANIDAQLMSKLFFGVSSTVGQLKIASNETQVIASGSVTVANAATYKSDLGVKVKTSGVALRRVASAPAAGEYSVDVLTGIYSFDSGLAGSVVLDYEFTVAGSGQTVVLSNQTLGEQPIFGVTLKTAYAGKQVVMKLNACVATKYTFATKQEDFVIPDFEFSCFTDASDELGTISTSV